MQTKTNANQLSLLNSLSQQQTFSYNRPSNSKLETHKSTSTEQNLAGSRAYT